MGVLLGTLPWDSYSMASHCQPVGDQDVKSGHWLQSLRRLSFKWWKTVTESGWWGWCVCVCVWLATDNSLLKKNAFVIQFPSGESHTQFHTQLHTLSVHPSRVHKLQEVCKCSFDSLYMTVTTCVWWKLQILLNTYWTCGFYRYLNKKHLSTFLIGLQIVLTFIWNKKYLCVHWQMLSEGDSIRYESLNTFVKRCIYSFWDCSDPIAV